MGIVQEIYIAAIGGGPMQARPAVSVEAGRGIPGDRYYAETGTFSKQLAGLPDKEITLIEAEQIDAFNQAYDHAYNSGDFRRNLVTQGVDLNGLVGKHFSINGVNFRGVRLCEPCAHLATVLSADVVAGMVHKAGLRAEIVSNGELRRGDEIVYA